METKRPKLVRAHPDADFAVLEDLLGDIKLSKDLKRSLRIKVQNHALGLSRRNKDYKRLIGFQEFHLVELRWSFNLGGREIPVRLICSESVDGLLILLGWHIKDPELPSESQREFMNFACVEAIERLETIDWC